MLKRWWNYIKTWFGAKSEEVMDPEIQLQQAVDEFRERDQELRGQAAKVLAHRTQVAEELEDATKDSAEAKELAKQALLKADAAAKAGDAAEAERWNQAAQTIAVKLQASESNVATLTEQLTIAEQQAANAREAVSANAAELSELSAKQTELTGKIKSAEMQESLNRTMEQLNASVGDEAPSLKEIEDKIESRAAQAAAEADIAASTPEGAMAELEKSVDLSEADSTLDSLRSELGLAPAVTTGGSEPTTPPGSSGSTTQP
jgi:phage shock protein A